MLCFGGQNNDPFFGGRREDIVLFRSSQQLQQPSVWLLKGAVSALKNPNLALCVGSWSSEKQGHQPVCLARGGGPTTLSKTTDVKLGCVFVKSLFYFDPGLYICHQNRIELVTGPEPKGWDWLLPRPILLPQPHSLLLVHQSKRHRQNQAQSLSNPRQWLNQTYLLNQHSLTILPLLQTPLPRNECWTLTPVRSYFCKLPAHYKVLKVSCYTHFTKVLSTHVT